MGEQQHDDNSKIKWQTSPDKPWRSLDEVLPDLTPVDAPPRTIRMHIVLVFVLIAIIVCLTLVIRSLVNGQYNSSATAGLDSGNSQVPAAVIQVAGSLTSQNISQVRSILAPALSARLPSTGLFPAGSKIVVSSYSWIGSGTYGDATAVLSSPGKAPQNIQLGFTDASGNWKVSSESVAP